MAYIESEILDHHGVLSTDPKSGWKTELNTVSWGRDPEKYDIRSWAPDHERGGKGVRLTAEELRELRNILNTMNLDD